MSEPRSIVALAVLLLATGAGSPARGDGSTVAGDTLRLDLAACLAEAVARSPSLAAVAAMGDEARATASEAAARRRPVLGAGGAYQYTSEHMRRDLELGFGLPPRTLEFGDGHVADVNLGVAIPVYTGGELGRAAAAAEAGAQAAALRLDSARLDLARGVRQAWCGTLGRQAQVDASALAVARLARHHASTDAARAAGAASEESVVRAAARLLAARQRLTGAEAARDSAALALGRLIGRPGAVVLAAGDERASLLGDGPDVAEPDRSDSAAARPDLAALALETRRQHELAAAARGRLRPRVLADVRAHYGRPGVDALTNEWMGYGTAGISIEWPLWDAGARQQRARQAEARALWSEALRRDLAEVVTLAEATARTNLRAARLQAAAATERVALQDRLLTMVRSRHEQAAATETELLDAHDDLAQAESELALAHTRVRLAEAALLWALGS